MNINNRLDSLKQKMGQFNVKAYIIPSSDPHQSEYVADHWMSRAWISGFDGSAGTAVITENFAGVWVDSRYYLQAEQQLRHTDFEMKKLQYRAVPEYLQWIAEHLSEGDTLGMDGKLLSVSQYRTIKNFLDPFGIKIDIDLDLIAMIWKDRPAIPTEQVFEHTLDFAVRSRKQKLEKLKKYLEDHDIQHLLVNALDNVAWLLNIRGNDIPCNPVSVAYLLFSQNGKATLFINEKKLDANLKNALEQDGVRLSPYEDIRNVLSKIDPTHRIALDPHTTSILLYNSISTTHIVEERNIITREKACKSRGEIEHIHNAMAKDGAALARAFRWMESNITNGFTEVELGKKLQYYRAQMNGYHQESFDAIVGYRANGAIVHYRAHPSTCATIKPEGLLLVDSGGQYLDGTTDITRTFSMGNPTEEEKISNTLVLKGMIALANAKFPKGTMGIQLDVLARQFLWSHGLNYGHGTGHGVGYFLNVHEPPQGIAPGLQERGKTSLKVGMIVSNEPGYYKQGHFGIRIENLIAVRPVEGQDDFFEFELLTMYPYDLTLINKSMLSDEEIAWINKHHDLSYTKIAPLLHEDERAWFKTKCRHI